MSADRVITCTNKNNDTVTFRETGFFPFLLVSAEGVYDSKNDVFVMDNTSTDGSIYQGSRTPFRNIVLTVKDISIPKGFYGDADTYITNAVLRDKTLDIYETINPVDIEEETEGEELVITSAAIKGKSIDIYSSIKSSKSIEGKDFVDHRQILDKVFKKNETGRLSFSEYGEERVIDYYVESVTSTGTHSSRLHTISLICPDPFFYNPNEEDYRLGVLDPNIEFYWELFEDGDEFGRFNITYSRIYNESANDNIGLTIMIYGDADIINPGITRLESGEFIRLGTDSNPFNLEAGDLIVITTGIGNKHVYLTSNGVTTEVNYLIREGSSFVQLMRGENTLYFNCDSGRTTAHIEIKYRLQYARA